MNSSFCICSYLYSKIGCFLYLAPFDNTFLFQVSGFYTPLEHADIWSKESA